MKENESLWRDKGQGPKNNVGSRHHQENLRKKGEAGRVRVRKGLSQGGVERTGTFAYRRGVFRAENEVPRGK